MTHTSANVQIAPESVPSTPSWFGEVAIVAHVLTGSGLLENDSPFEIIAMEKKAQTDVMHER
jgi:hypothetical protein